MQNLPTAYVALVPTLRVGTPGGRSAVLARLGKSVLEKMDRELRECGSGGDRKSCCSAPRPQRAIIRSRSAAVGNIAKPHHPLPLFVPQLKRRASQAVAEPERDALAKRRFGVVARRQMVVGDAAVEMVDVVVSNVAGEPLQYGR